MKTRMQTYTRAILSPTRLITAMGLVIMITFALALATARSLAVSNEKSTTVERLNDSASLFSEVMSTPDKAIPQSLLDQAYCIVLVPDLKKGAFLIGGTYGRGYALCRHGGGVGWGAPAAIRIEGGSFGLQAGVSSTDLILLVMNERGMKRLMTSKFTIGAEATAAAGPVGRNVTAQTDALLMAEILSWSRARGLFAGISLDGSTLRNDIDENEAMYGQRWDSKQILTTRTKAPAAASRLIAELNKYSPRETH
jgi:SH3 domain-containing YSC84-like protein 1